MALKKSAQKFLLFIVTLGLSDVTLAGADGVNYSIHHQYIAPRALGMGNAFVAVANDYNSIMYNPAGLARLEFGEVNLGLDGGFASSFTNFANDLTKAQNKSGTESDKQQAVLDVIEKVYGKTFGVRGGLSGLWARPNWGLAVIPVDMTTEMVPHQQVGPSINTTFYLDSTIAYAYAKDVYWFPHSRTSVGVTAKFVNRAHVSKAINFMEIAVDPNLVKQDDLREGYTLDADIGMLYTPELPSEGFLSWFKMARPTFGAVLRNSLETGFGQSLKLINPESLSRPEKMYRVLDVGSKWEYPSVWIFKGRGVLDIRDIGHPSFNTRKGLHLGLEFDWRMASWWRGNYRIGLNQGYLTAGLSALFSYFNLDFVSYGEDVGTYSKPQENRIFMIKLNVNI